MENEKVDILALSKKIGLTPDSYKEPKQLYYNGILSDNIVKCDLIGLDTQKPLIAIIKTENIVQKIDVDYLKEMQPTKKELIANGLL